MDESNNLKPLLWVGSSKRDLLEMPPDVVSDFGYGLFEAQLGDHPDMGKTLSGFGSAKVIELVANHHAGAFRAVYTVQFADAVIVLHSFQKKIKKGIQTSKQDIELIKSRLKLAEELYIEWKRSEKKSCARKTKATK